MQNEPSTSSAFCFFQGHKGDTRERKIEGEVEGSQPSKRFCLLLPVWARSNCSLDVSRTHNQRQLASEKASFAPLHSARRALYVEPMPRRKLFPIPIEGAVDHPDFVAMPSAAAGSLFRIILHFWQTQCRSLPIADWELRSIARAHAPTWRRWKLQILNVFEAIRPELEAYRRLRESHATTIRFAGRRGGQTSAAKQRHKTLAAKAEAEFAQSRMNTTPRRLLLQPDRPLPPGERPPRARARPSRNG